MWQRGWLWVAKRTTADWILIATPPPLGYNLRWAGPSSKETAMQSTLNFTISLLVLLSLAATGFTQEKAAKAPVRTAPLTVTGKAVDETGQPINGATIYLVSTNGSPAKTLGQVTT